MDAPKGLIAATFTPMDSGGMPDLAAIPRTIDHLLRSGVAGIYALGSTGEGPSLTFDERREAATAFVEAARGRLPVIVQVGHESLAQARALAEHAQVVGAQAVSAVCPVYFKPDSVVTLVDAMASIAAGAPSLPFYYYHIPSVTGVALSMIEFLRLGGERIPTLRGIKYTSPDLAEFQSCLEFERGRFDLFYGRDEMLLGALAVGATAAVGSTYNFAAPVYNRLRAAFARGDMAGARREQSRSLALVDIIIRHGPRASQKAIMALIGLDCGPSRLPIRPLSPVQREALRADLEAIGYFDWGLEAPNAGTHH